MRQTPRYAEALTYAAALHLQQKRKGSGIPYISHVLAVSSLVWEAGGSQEEAIASLLHDALEDQGEHTSYEEISSRFGPRVAEIVRACSDTEQVPKPPWRERKQAYLEHLRTADEGTLRVSLADKLHNARSILSDGPDVWARFSAGREEQLWYYGALADIFAERLPSPQSSGLVRVVIALADME